MPHALTADLCARAIIAACRSYGGDPVRAVTERRNCMQRRGMAPAAIAVAQATGATQYRIGKLFGLSSSTLSDARRLGAPSHRLALTQALLAVGGPSLALAPVEPSKASPVKPLPELYSDEPDRLLQPRSDTSPVDLGVVTSVPVPAPVTQTALPPPPSRPAAKSGLEERNASIVQYSADGESPSEISRKVGLAIGVVACVLYRARRRSGLATAGSKVSEADRALIQSAEAQGKVTVLPTAVADGVCVHGVALPDHPEPPKYDRAAGGLSRAETATAGNGWGAPKAKTMGERALARRQGGVGHG